MSLFDEFEVAVIDDLSQGVDEQSGPTLTESRHYAEGDNLLLTRNLPQTIGGLTRFSATAAPNSETIIYCVPFSLVGSATEHLVYTSGGTWYRLLSNTYTQLRSGLSAAPTYLTHAPFRARIVLANGVDAVQGYDGTTMIPIGTKLVSDCGATPLPAGTWTGGTNYTANVRQGTEARNLSQVGAGTATMRVAYTATQNFLTGPQSGDPDFDAAASGDAFRAQVYVVSGAANITSVDFRFYTTYATAYFQATATGFSAGWNSLSLTRNGMTTVLAPVWSSITTFEVRLITTGNAEIAVDDCLMQYITNPVPVGNIVIIYNNFLLVGDQSADRVRVGFSDVNQIDSFPSANFTRITAGGYHLEVPDRITCMKVYLNVLIIGKPRSAHALSGVPGNISVEALTTEAGIDGHNSTIEAPLALLYLYGNQIYGFRFRLTGRESVSRSIAPMLNSLDLSNAQAHVAIRHDETHTVRWSFRQSGQSQNNLQLIYDWFRNAWASECTYAVRHYYPTLVSGIREIHVVQYDGFLRRADVGTDFDGTAIASRLRFAWISGPRRKPNDVPALCRWVGAILMLDGTANVIVEYRVADTPSEMEGAFTAAENSPLDANAPSAEKHTVTFPDAFGRFLQVQLRTTSGTMIVHPPAFFYYHPVAGRRGP